MSFLRRLVLVICFSLFTSAAFAHGFDHSALDRFLKQYVDAEGRVNYAAAKQNRADLDLYLEQIRNVNRTAVSSAPKLEQIAFWLNVYHAGLLALVLESYPIKSTEEIPNFWERQFIQTGVKEDEDPKKAPRYSLSQIRNKVLIAQFGNEKVHMALAYAAKDGPLFPQEVFTGPRVLGQLIKAARREVAREKTMKIDSTAGVLRLSRIFEWHAADFIKNFGRPERRARFGRMDTSVINFLIRYTKDIEKVRFLKAAAYRLEYAPFDWTLNDTVA